jgi:hypothetical protein
MKNKDPLVRRITPTLMSIDSVPEIPMSEPSITDDEVRTTFQHLYPGFDIKGLTRLQMLMVIGRKFLEGK